MATAYRGALLLTEASHGRMRCWLAACLLAAALVNCAHGKIKPNIIWNNDARARLENDAVKCLTKEECRKGEYCNTQVSRPWPPPRMPTHNSRQLPIPHCMARDLMAGSSRIPATRELPTRACALRRPISSTHRKPSGRR